MGRGARVRGVRSVCLCVCVCVCVCMCVSVCVTDEAVRLSVSIASAARGGARPSFSFSSSPSPPSRSIDWSVLAPHGTPPFPPSDRVAAGRAPLNEAVLPRGGQPVDPNLCWSWEHEVGRRVDGSARK